MAFCADPRKAADSQRPSKNGSGSNNSSPGDLVNVRSERQLLWLSAAKLDLFSVHRSVPLGLVLATAVTLVGNTFTRNRVQSAIPLHDLPVVMFLRFILGLCGTRLALLALLALLELVVRRCRLAEVQAISRGWSRDELFEEEKVDFSQADIFPLPFATSCGTVLRLMLQAPSALE